MSNLWCGEVSVKPPGSGAALSQKVGLLNMRFKRPNGDFFQRLVHYALFKMYFSAVVGRAEW